MPGSVEVISARSDVEQIHDRPLEQLQRDVAREAVGDDHVGGAAQQVAALGVAGEVEAALAQQRVRVERQRVALLVLLADREEAHLGVRGRRAARG